MGVLADMHCAFLRQAHKVLKAQSSKRQDIIKGAQGQKEKESETSDLRLMENLLGSSKTCHHHFL